MAVKMGLQSKILLLVTCGLAAIFSIFTYLGLQTLNESNERSLQGRLDLAKLIAAHSDEQLREALALLSGFAEPALLDDRHADLGARRGALSQLYLRSAFFSYGVFLADAQGRVVWSEPHLRFPVNSHLPAYDRQLPALAAGEPQVSDLVTHPLTRVPLVMLAVPIRNADGKLLGMVGTATDLSAGSLSLLLEPVSLGVTGYAEIVDRDGQVLASSRPDRLFRKDDHADRFLTLINDQQPVVGRCHRCHQALSDARQNDLLAFAPLQRAPWGVALRQLEDEVLAPSRAMAQGIVLVAVPLFALTLAAAWITTSRVVGPIRGLTAASERIADGDLDFAVDQSGNDELGTLARAFDTMRKRLKASYDEIEALNRDLEQRVEQRTRDLSSIFEASQLAASTRDVDTLLGALVARLVVVVRQAGAGVLYLETEDGQLAPRSSHGYDQALLNRLRLAPGEGIAGKVYRSGQALLLTDPEAVAAASGDLRDDNALLWRQAAAAIGEPRGVVGVPLVAKGRVIGALVLDNFDAGQSFSDVELSLVQTIADRIAVAIENARLYEEVQQKEQLRGQLLEKVIVAQEEERRRIARELHDETGQSLTALAIRLASAQDHLPENANGSRDAVEQAKILADKLLAEIRRLISDLRPTVLDDLGLVPALRRYASTHAELLKLDIQLTVEGRRRRLSPQVETVLFRIVQEAITNVAKHAEAKRVAIKLTFGDTRATVVVQDDGRGFDVAEALGAGGLHRGVGLLGMRERTALLGGTLEVVSHAGSGTVLTVSLPLEQEEAFVLD